MNSLKSHPHVWLSRSILLKDIVAFFRPVDFSAENTPTETAGVANVLPFSQERFGASQLLFRLLRGRGIQYPPNKPRASRVIFCVILHTSADLVHRVRQYNAGVA